MSQIDTLTEELKKTIIESDEYKEFLRLSEIVDKYPDIKIKVKNANDNVKGMIQRVENTVV